MANKPGVHKKRSINIAKAKKRMTKKGKKKVKEAIRIAKTNKHKSLKQKGMMVDTARAEAKKPKISGDMSSEVSAVDKLFADMQEGEEDELVPVDPEDDASSDGDGAFHDIGEGGGQEPESEEDLEHHADELSAIKEKDPEFYKFLQETNKGLLDFQDVAEEEGEDNEEIGEEEREQKQAKKEVLQRTKNILTHERLRFVQENCKDSWNSLMAASNFFHTAVRTLESAAKVSTDDKWQEYEAIRKRKEDREAGIKPKWGKEEPKKKKKAPEIHHESVFSEVIEWSLANLIGVFTSFASKGRKESLPKKRWYGKKHFRIEEPQAQEDLPGVLQVWTLPQFQKVNRYAQYFWSDVMYFLRQLADQQMIEFVLRHISTPEAISWLWSNAEQRRMLLRNTSKLWAEAKSQPVRLNAFLFLRNAATMSLALKTKGKQESMLLDSLIRDMFRNFAEVARGGYTWRSVNSFRVMENCFLEMLKLDDKTAYRLAFQCVRQLASILRNSCIARSTLKRAGQIDNMKGQNFSQARGRSKKVSDSKKKKVEKSKQDQQALMTWPFVRGMYLWTKAIGTLPALRELAYPLSMTILGTVKTRHYTLAMFPLVYHCLYCLNRVAANLEVYIPISALILTTFDKLNVGIDKTFHMNRKNKARGKKKADEIEGEDRVLSHAKAPEVEVLIHFSKGLVDEPLCQETMGSSLLFLLVDHMGLLSRSPAFPEIVSMVLLHVRKLRKQCGSEALRRQLTTFIQLAETTISDVQSRRDYLKEAPSFKKFLVWGPDTALAKHREDMLKRKMEEEKQRIEAEVQEKPDKAGAEEALVGKKKSRGGRKTREALAAKAAKAEKDAARAERRIARQQAEEDAQGENERKRQKVEDLKGADDKVEEMGFSSGDDADE